MLIAFINLPCGGSGWLITFQRAFGHASSAVLQPITKLERFGPRILTKCVAGEVPPDYRSLPMQCKVFKAHLVVFTVLLLGCCVCFTVVSFSSTIFTCVHLHVHIMYAYIQLHVHVVSALGDLYKHVLPL